MFDFDEIEEEVKAKGDWKESKTIEPASAADSPPPPKPETKSSGGGDGGMFDFDEIEDDMQKQQARPPKPETKSSGGGDGGMFDFDEIEDDMQKQQAAAASTMAKNKDKSVSVKIRFFYRGQHWTRAIEVDKGTTALELRRRLVAEGGQPEEDASYFQLLDSGRPLGDADVLVVDSRLSFAFQPPLDAPARERRPRDVELPQPSTMDSNRELAVTVTTAASLGVSTVLSVRDGTTVRELKNKMAKQDPTGQTKLEDFGLKVDGTTRTLRDEEKISEATTWLTLCRGG